MLYNDSDLCHSIWNNGKFSFKKMKYLSQINIPSSCSVITICQLFWNQSQIYVSFVSAEIKTIPTKPTKIYEWNSNGTVFFPFLSLSHRKWRTFLTSKNVWNLHKLNELHSLIFQDNYKSRFMTAELMYIVHSHCTPYCMHCQSNSNLLRGFQLD